MRARVPGQHGQSTSPARRGLHRGPGSAAGSFRLACKGRRGCGREKGDHGTKAGPVALCRYCLSSQPSTEGQQQQRTRPVQRGLAWQIVTCSLSCLVAKGNARRAAKLHQTRSGRHATKLSIACTGGQDLGWAPASILKGDRRSAIARSSCSPRVEKREGRGRRNGREAWRRDLAVKEVCLVS